MLFEKSPTVFSSTLVLNPSLSALYIAAYDLFEVLELSFYLILPKKASIINAAECGIRKMHMNGLYRYVAILYIAQFRPQPSVALGGNETVNLISTF